MIGGTRWPALFDVFSILFWPLLAVGTLFAVGYAVTRGRVELVLSRWVDQQRRNGQQVMTALTFVSWPTRHGAASELIGHLHLLQPGTVIAGTARTRELADLYCAKGGATRPLPKYPRAVVWQYHEVDHTANAL